MENTLNKPFTKSEVEYSIRKSLMTEFNSADCDRQIQIYKTVEYLNKNQYTSFNFEEELAEMRSDIKSDHNIEMK